MRCVEQCNLHRTNSRFWSWICDGIPDKCMLCRYRSWQTSLYEPDDSRFSIPGHKTTSYVACPISVRCCLYNQDYITAQWCAIHTGSLLLVATDGCVYTIDYTVSVPRGTMQRHASENDACLDGCRMQQLNVEACSSTYLLGNCTCFVSELAEYVH
jgi:hypothetical protein